MKDEHRQVLQSEMRHGGRCEIPDHELLELSITEMINRRHDINTLKRQLLAVGHYYERELVSLAARFHKAHEIEN
ncbi:MAG TPA: hypothetical protein VFC78_11075 [Tepidisphaeraceae bacterium]|nr:hypothetical protein [Tepidisphaeraceae bacterium]